MHDGLSKKEWLAAHKDENIEKQICAPYHYDLGHERIEIDGEYDIFKDGI